jgi:hypothetical protein
VEKVKEENNILQLMKKKRIGLVGFYGHSTVVEHSFHHSKVRGFSPNVKEKTCFQWPVL